jgi:hypothetical protein
MALERKLEHRLEIVDPYEKNTRASFVKTTNGKLDIFIRIDNRIAGAVYLTEEQRYELADWLLDG